MTYSIKIDDFVNYHPLRKFEETIELVTLSLEVFTKQFLTDHGKLNTDIKHFFITGGIIPNMYKYYSGKREGSIQDFIGNAASDIDIFVNAPDKNRLINLCIPLIERWEQYLVQRPKEDKDMSDEEKDMEKYSSIVDGVGPNSFCFDTKGNPGPFVLPRIQVVHSLYGAPSRIMSSFDMDHLRSFYDPFNNKIFLSQASQYCLMTGNIFFGNNGQFATVSDTRLQKWTDRGWIDNTKN